MELKNQVKQAEEALKKLKEEMERQRNGGN